MDILALSAQGPAGAGAVRLLVMLSLASGADLALPVHAIEAVFAGPEGEEGGDAEGRAAFEAWRTFCQEFQPRDDLDLDALLDEQYAP